MGVFDRLKQKRPWLIAASAVLLVLLLPYLYARITHGSRRLKVYAGPSDNPNHAAAVAPESLRLMCFNIAHGRGLAESNWQGGSRSQRSERLKEIGQLLQEIDADIVVLNEVDFCSSWSQKVNQAEELAEQAGYPYRLEQTNFDIRTGWLSWRFGNAVLSKYPITDASFIELPSKSALEAAFAGQKQAATCSVQFASKAIQLVAVHLEYRSETVRARSAIRMLSALASEENPTLLLGDFNSIPTERPPERLDFSSSTAMDLLDQSGRFQRNKRTSGATFPADNPSRTIDWILIPTSATFKTYQVVETTLSDHRPVVADVIF